MWVKVKHALKIKLTKWNALEVGEHILGLWFSCTIYKFFEPLSLFTCKSSYSNLFFTSFQIYQNFPRLKLLET